MMWQAQTIFTCDRCGTTLTVRSSAKLPETWARLTIGFADPDNDIQQDLCRDCADVIVATVLPTADHDCPTPNEEAAE